MLVRATLDRKLLPVTAIRSISKRSSDSSMRFSTRPGLPSWTILSDRSTALNPVSPSTNAYWTVVAPKQIPRFFMDKAPICFLFDNVVVQG